MKELTQSEIEKTERLSNACSQLVASEATVVSDKKPSFGVSSESTPKPRMTNVSSEQVYQKPSTR